MDNNDNDTVVFKSSGKITIPPQLAEFEGARFITIDKTAGMGKKPKERKWTTEKNYAANDAVIQGHIRGGGNYGIATGYGSLNCFDADEFEILNELGIIEKIPKTLTVRTGRASSEGRHYWLKIKGLQKRIVFYHPETKDIDDPDQYMHLGEVKSKGNYAIGPGSLHKSGRRYEIIDNSPISEISYEQLLEILKPLRLKKKDDRPKDTKYERAGNNHEEVDLEKISWPRGDVEKVKGTNGVEYRGTNPFHGSKTGKNFSVNTTKGVWHCFRCGSGGGWKELLAVKEGIISCEQAGPKCLTKSQYREVMKRAEELGLIEETTINAPIAEIELDREELEQIPRAMPNGDVVVLIAPPRTGKTHSVVQWLADNGNGNYITHTHAIIEHAIKIARELKMDRVVWMVGMNQPGACRQQDAVGNCKKCPLQNTQSNFYRNQNDARKLLEEKRILTAADVPLNMCPYSTLKIAEKHARYCFTVVNNINAIVPRSLTILDEEPVLSHFYATSIEVATIKTRVGETATKNYIEKSKNLQVELDRILNHRKKPNLKEYAEKIQEIQRIISRGIDEGDGASDIADAIEDALINFAPTHREVRDQGESEEGEDMSMETCVRCLGNLYRENPVSVVKKSGGYQSIYILGDERKTCYAMDWLSKTKKVIIIGATKAEIFAQEFGGREIIIPKFRYDARFMLIGVDKKGDGTDRGAAQAQKKKVIDIARDLWRNSEAESRMPFMVLTGSKKEQDRAASMLSGATKAANERENAMISEFISGKPVIMYQNSCISRGLDVDQYNLLLVYGCDFAQPFWMVANEGVAAAIISDETTNSVLRISSTLRRDDETLKVVVMQKKDIGKVKYLTDSRILSNGAGEVAAVLRSMKIGGRIGRAGRRKLKVTAEGVNFEEGKGKLIELLSNSGEIIDEEMRDAVKLKIISFLKENTNNKIRWVSTHTIKNHLGKVCGSELVRSALADLSYHKILISEKVGSSFKWRLKHK